MVGVYPRERGRPQPLRIDIELSIDTEAAATTGRLSRTVDYDRTAQAVIFILQSCRFGLLETAAHALAKFLLIPPISADRSALVRAARVQLTKPDALMGAAVAALSIERDAAWAAVAREQKPFGSIDLVFLSREASIVRVNLAPRGELGTRDQPEAHDAELALTAGLVCDGVPFPSGAKRSQGRGAPRRLQNPTRRWQSVLSVDSPGTTRAPSEIAANRPTSAVGGLSADPVD
ncbi:MAG: dihydroneopterin aldolase [Myxococcales bacterium]|nr:dihydroneopterin aldolase [Myxococcales bacterium]